MDDLYFDFTGRSVLITGSGGAIGREVALAFARQGANLALCDVDKGKLGNVQKEVEAIGRQVYATTVDVRSSSEVESFVANAWQQLGAIDVLVNTAAIYDRAPSTEFPEERFDRVIDINLKGTWLMCQAVGKRMVERGQGRIINYASNAGIRGTPEQIAYNVSKAGVIVLTKSLAIEWARRGVTVNAVSPGPTDTPLMASTFASDAVREGFISKIPLGALTPPDVTVGPVLFLASDQSKWITGHTLFADGGMSAL